MELALEIIGDDVIQMMRSVEQLEREAGVRDRAPSPYPWCAEVIGERASGRPEIRFLRGRRDYSQANSVGSRGVFLWFELQEGHCYWVNAHESWKRKRRYYVTVHQGAVIEISEEDAIAWVTGQQAENDRSTTTS